jgi:hypothetical protein
MNRIDPNEVDYMIVVKKSGDWTVFDGSGEEEWREVELKEFQARDPNLANARTRKVLVEYEINPRLVCIGNYCRYI